MYRLKSLPEFDAWLAGLSDPLVHATVMKRLKRVQLGLLGDVRHLGDGVFELKIALGAGWRVYCTQRNEKIIFLLAGGSKRTQQRDIERAKALAENIAFTDQKESVDEKNENRGKRKNQGQGHS